MPELPDGHPLSLRGNGMRPHTPYASLDEWHDDLLKWAMAYARLPTPGPRGLNDARDVLQNAAEWLAHWRLPLPDWFLAEGEPASVVDAVRRMRRLAEEFRPEQAELSYAECPTCGEPAPIDDFNTLRCPDCGDFQGKFAELWIDLSTHGPLSKDDSGDETLCALRHEMREHFATFDVTGLSMLRDWLVADHGMTRDQVFVTKRTQLLELLKNKSPKKPAEVLSNATSAAGAVGESGSGESSKIPDAVPASQPLTLEPSYVYNASHMSKKAKRSTERGEGRLKLIAALTKHHQYATGGCLNLEPIGNNELARKAEVDQATASAFFKKEFKGHGQCKSACADAAGLTAALKLLNGDFSSHHLYGANPPEKCERDEE